MEIKENYTIKEIADDLSVTKSAIQQRMTDKFREKFVSRKKINGRMTLIVSREGYLKLKSEIKSRNKVDDDDVILVLKDQLKKKDEQIAKLQILLNQSQQLQLQQNEKIKLLETSAKKHWWQRLFK